MSQATDRVTQIVERLRQRGAKLTPQRQAIIEALVAHDNHPTVGEIYDAIRGRFPMIALTTVYDTLQLLVEGGAIGALWPYTAVQRYDPNAEPHAHLVCIRCRQVIDIPLGSCPCQPTIIAEKGFHVLRQICEFHGLCAECQKAASTAG